MKDAPESSGPQLVEDAAAVKLLADGGKRRFLYPFLGREATVGAAAAELGVPLLTMFRWTRRLEALGLVSAGRRAKRRGKPLVYYRSVADELFVPPERLPLERLLERNDALWQDKLLRGYLHAGLGAAQRDLGIGIRFYRDGLQVVARPAYPPGPAWGRNWEPLAHHEAALFHVWKSVQLEFDDAKALQRELAELLARYSDKSGPQSYVLRLALAPEVS